MAQRWKSKSPGPRGSCTALQPQASRIGPFLNGWSAGLMSQIERWEYEPSWRYLGLSYKQNSKSVRDTFLCTISQSLALADILVCASVSTGSFHWEVQTPWTAAGKTEVAAGPVAAVLRVQGWGGRWIFFFFFFPWFCLERAVRSQAGDCLWAPEWKRTLGRRSQPQRCNGVRRLQA